MSKIVPKITKQIATPRKISRKALLEAIRQTAGNVSEMAILFDCPRDRLKIYKALDKYDLRKELNEGREILVDLAESKIKKAVSDGDAQAATFVLRTLGRKRGWGDHITVEHEGKKTPEEELEERLEGLEHEDQPGNI